MTTLATLIAASLLLGAVLLWYQHRKHSVTPADRYMLLLTAMAATTLAPLLAPLLRLSRVWRNFERALCCG